MSSVALSLLTDKLSRRLLIRWKCHVAPQPHKPQCRFTVCSFRRGKWLNLCGHRQKPIYCTWSLIYSTSRLSGKVCAANQEVWCLIMFKKTSRAQVVGILHKHSVYRFVSWSAVTVCHNCNCKPLNDVDRRHLWQAQMLFGLILNFCLYVCVGTWGVYGLIL